MYRRKEGKMKVKIGAHKGLILTLSLNDTAGYRCYIECGFFNFNLLYFIF